MKINEPEIRAILNHYSGSEKRYPHPFHKSLFYSEGVHKMVELCEAHWLASDVLLAMRIFSTQHPFVTAKVFRSTGALNCTIRYEDGNGTKLCKVDYELTDFPLSDILKDGATYPALTLFFQNGILYLPSEH